MKIKDIAQEAKVSATTVSNVLNGNYAKVSVATAEKIQEIIEKYNYVPKASARNLAAKSTRIIGVILPGILYNNNPHNALLVSAIEKLIRSQGYYMLLSCADTMENAITTLTMWDVDGAIMTGYVEEDMASVLKGGQRDFPVMLIDSYIMEEYPGCMCVRVNDYKGGYIAGRYLLAAGHKNLMFAGAPYRTSGVVHQRYRGFCDALGEQGIVLTEDAVVECDTTYEGGIQAGKAISDLNFDCSPQNRVTAVFASSDITATGIIEGAGLCGMRVPKDLSVVGFDNINFSACTTPKLTTISQDIGKKAERAAALLIEAIRSGRPCTDLTIIEPELVERQSVWRVGEY